jgi:hypothetical protein
MTIRYNTKHTHPSPRIQSYNPQEPKPINPLDNQNTIRKRLESQEQWPFAAYETGIKDWR